MTTYIPKRLLIVAVARTYLGTPFQPQGRVRGRGLDCVGLPLCVAEELGLKDRHGREFHRSDHLGYPSQPVDRRVHEICQQRLIEKPVGEIAAGDVITVQSDVLPCHVAIVVDMHHAWGMIHAYNPLDKVVENIISEKWQRRIEGCFSFPGVD